MTGTIERLPGRCVQPAPSDWAAAGFPVMDTVPRTHGLHVEERLTDGTYVLLAEVPGFDAEDIEIIITEGTLSLRAQHGTVPDDGYVYGHHTPLPTGAKGDEATASYEHGVLTITMPVPGSGSRSQPSGP
ncbi:MULTISPECIES: Hsp20/alpha crystallin family protein [Streptomyces]|uniref:Hsp20/alpha crystallin family protein n=1 Tax=Streptomyces TaxID=1883 RepID=UPI00073DEF78|nr:Hsp20/alpha crystallin family protein [Streptomyces sp. EAS-AB2608]BCM72900.1 hypothetical protein EASAB2608_08234 [Streptomyces sp. EAS-AB2608]CUW33181.1 Alpha-crystallin [Streptomyces reticuli]